MNFLEAIFKEILSFFRIDRLINNFEKSGIDALLSFQGITSILLFLIPILLLIEIFRSVFIYKKGVRGYTLSLVVYIVNRIIKRSLSFAVVALCIALFKPYALFEVPLTWYGFIYGYIIWELGHFIYHYFGHKVRLFWCLHSSHHAPEDMNLSVNYSHFFLEAPYADFIRTTTCILLGVNPVMLAMIMVIDWIWGEFIHVSEDTIKNARFGKFGEYFLTPSHHRVHHSRNEIYMDTNFGNLLNIWDKIFGTYQAELETLKPEYGISRKINPNSFYDLYFGEIVELAKDVYRAPGLKNKFLYILMPPGWSHTGEYKLAKDLRTKALEEISA